MADDDGESSRKPMSSYNRPQEAFQRGQEAQVEQRFPSHPTGIIPLPRGSRGAKSLYLKREGNSFGFTLRHFIIYPPESVVDQDDRHAKIGALYEPMDTIFVRKVHDGSPAKRAGLQYGDRLVAVNNISVKDKSYNQVVKLIANSPEYLHLLVVPKEEDIIQRFFSDTAYNPASNQPTYPEAPYDRQTAQKIITQRIQHHPYELRADPRSWQALQQLQQQRYYHHPEYGNLNRAAAVNLGQRSADNLLYRDDYKSRTSVTPNQQEIYAEIHPNETSYTQRSRAQPQVPLYRKMGRRASEGNALSEREHYYEESPIYAGVNSEAGDLYRNTNNMKAMYKSNYLPEASQNREMLGLNYPVSAGCRLSMDVGRRESTTSLSSSNADSSKDSLSYDSSSTVTGHYTENPRINERIRNSFQQKEEFLRTPYTITEQGLGHREFYGRPKKLERAVWPPNEPIRQESPSRTIKPNHQNFLRVKNDIDNERDLQQMPNGSPMQGAGGVANNMPYQKGVKSPREKNFQNNLDNIYEASVAPSGYDAYEPINGAQTMDDLYMDDRRLYPQMVHRRAKEFESGKPLPEDDPMSNRIDFTRNELARISSKKLVPNVTERAQEYEIRAVERDNSGTSTNSGSTINNRRIQRDARSLDSSGSNASSGSVNEDLAGKLVGSGSSKKLSGNVTISSGSKFIHCPPPSEYGKPTDTSGNETIRQRVRSNSAESWVAALGSDDRDKRDTSKRISRQDAVAAADRNKATANEAMDVSAQPLYADLPPLIPEPVERMHLTPSVSITPAPSSMPPRPVRPNQLDLEGPVRPMRHLKAPSANTDSPVRRSISPVNWDDKPVVVKRRSKITNAADDERATRRESYLKATEGGRVDFHIDHSDGELSPQQLRSGSVSGNSSSSASLDREKISESPSEKDQFIIKEGPVLCKILEIDGKRAADRSWKQTWAVLRGPILYLYKDKNHQSPVGNSDVVDHPLAKGVDMRTNVVRVAEDYTKRKNVLRVSSITPNQSEFLLQTEELGEWLTVLKEQMPEAEAKLDPLNSNQQAVPQTNPACTTIQVQGSHLSPQLSKSSRNRSPTGQSPVSKSRKPSHTHDPATSPKSKTWAGRMVKQFRRMQGANSPSSPTAPEVSTFGIPIEHCLQGKNPYVPKLVETCTGIVEEKGLQVVGIYRVPGNNASITALTEEINKNYDDIPMEDQRWNDVNVVSSILKSFFRKMPDSLITVQLYPSFIEADKIEDPALRMGQLRKLVKRLPIHNYETLKHIINHLSRVVEKSDVNKMEAKNLAIVFGPTIVRSENDNMESMVNNMTNQCKIVETLLKNYDYFFSNVEPLEPPMVLTLPESDGNDYIEQANNELLLRNINKFETIGREKNPILTSLTGSLISAAQRIKKAPKQSSSQSKEEVTTPTSPKLFSPQLFSSTDLKENTTSDSKVHLIPTTVTEMESGHNRRSEAELKRRLEKFNREAQEDLQKARRTQTAIIEFDVRGKGSLSSSANNVNQNSRLSLKPTDMLVKTHSASNVYSRTTNADNSRNSLNSMDNSFPVQYTVNQNTSDQYSVSKHLTSGPSIVNNIALTDNFSDPSDLVSDRRGVRSVIRRGSSVENINSTSLDLNANGGMKKVKYENESDMNQRSGSLDSLNKQPSDGDSDLVRDITTACDQIIQKHSQHNLLAGDDLPFVDESPDKNPRESAQSDKENIPRSNDLYKNPCLHKSQYSANFKLKEIKYKESKKVKEKDEDTMTTNNVPDNERNISTHNKLTLTSNTNKLNSNLVSTGSKLRRSESLNKPERTVSPLTIKLKRSESLNKPGDKLKRSDSLTKNEKTESNNNKRRELSTSGRRSKENTKLKRKNGMPDRSIKRRHTVGGTKDPDKVTYVLDNKSEEEATSAKESKDKNLRTSSPDLSSTRRERLCLEINLVIGPRPQSFPESVFKVPLESHV